MSNGLDCRWMAAWSDGDRDVEVLSLLTCLDGRTFSDLGVGTSGHDHECLLSMVSPLRHLSRDEDGHRGQGCATLGKQLMHNLKYENELGLRRK